ncbi:hypothetical protein BY458DRAFT_558011 [Sporodiniella umbellata]|nr:hypothetical protein BY458DRAFT_558011 [Sporodiniella umbellata]
MNLPSYSLAQWLSYLGTWTKITTEGETYQGYLYTMDPETGHLVLYHQQRFLLFVHASILHFEFQVENRIDPNTMPTPNDSLELGRRKTELISCLEKARIPLNERQETVHVLSAVIQPPYTLVTGASALVRQRLQKVLIDGALPTLP